MMDTKKDLEWTQSIA